MLTKPSERRQNRFSSVLINQYQEPQDGVPASEIVEEIISGVSINDESHPIDGPDPKNKIIDTKPEPKRETKPARRPPKPEPEKSKTEEEALLTRYTVSRKTKGQANIITAYVPEGLFQDFQQIVFEKKFRTRGDAVILALRRFVEEERKK